MALMLLFIMIYIYWLC